METDTTMVTLRWEDFNNIGGCRFQECESILSALMTLISCRLNDKEIPSVWCDIEMEMESDVVKDRDGNILAIIRHPETDEAWSMQYSNSR